MLPPGTAPLKSAPVEFRVTNSYYGYFGENPGSRSPRALLREVFGNPFQSVALKSEWQTKDVETVAVAIYEDQSFDCLPVLSDALEEAGCTDADLLSHLRSPGPHVRGCWPVDLILGMA